MVQSPYKKGDVISLEDKYKIDSLLTEENKFWIFEGKQLSTNRKVLLKVFMNDKFSNIENVKNAWKEESKILQIEKEYQGATIEFIEAGVVKELENQFIIIFRYIDERAKLSDYLQEKKVIIEDDEEIEPSPIEEGAKIRSAAPKASVSMPTPPPSVGEEAPAFERNKELHKRKELIIDEKEEISLTDSNERLDNGLKKEKASAIEDKEYVKYISMEYFDRMNPQNYYPLTLNIADLIKEKISDVVNPITGERKVQKQSKLEAQLKNPLVLIRPFIPGCGVEPSEIETDFSLEKDEVTFFVTPGVKGKILGQIKFMNEGKIFHTIPVEAKIVDPNYARAVAAYGILASFIPKILSMLGIDLGLNLTLSILGGLGDISIASLIAFIGLIPAILISVIVRQRLRPRSCKTLFKIADFRVKGLRDKGII